MNKKIKEKLEFSKICQIISDYAITDFGKDYALNIDELNITDIKKSFEQITEAVNLLELAGNIPIENMNDISFSIKLLKACNSLTIKQLLDLLHVLNISKDLKKYFFDEFINQNDFPNLSIFFGNLYLNQGIIDELSKDIVDENTLDDYASKKLREIRNNIHKKESEIHSKLQSLLHTKYVQEPIVTVRNNRYVIPVKAEYRSEVKGFIHDISASGSSVFIEPMAIFDINNEISNLQNEEKIEIEKILMKLSSLFFEITDKIENTYNLIGLIDFIFAKAKFSKNYDCSEPDINTDKKINLINCYHPLLGKEKAVKNDIYLGQDFNILIITGPNTGGKTVALKTIGLISLMAKCGLHIPAKKGSSVYIFDKIFADIGDEQSISDSLSTFSSHITNISSILRNLTPNSLVLIDELGSGTDPVEGSSLAISIIKHLNNLQILSVITTHYHEIKNFALTTKGLKNASVEFDFDTLSPTYRLLIGVPGRSNAFIISKKLGIPDEIISNAKSYISEDANKIEDLLNSIYKDKKIIEHEKSEISSNLNQINKLKKELEVQKKVLNNDELKLIDEAKQKARDILLSAKEEANDIIKKLEKTQNVSDANKLRKNLNEKIEETNSKVDFSGLLNYNKNINYIPKKTKSEFKPSSVSPEINVIGQNVEEACFIVDKYLDNCVLNGLYTVRIVHGKGTGTLRTGIQSYLKHHPHVKSFRVGTFGEGEMGVTIVELK